MCLPLETISLSQHCFWSKFHQTIIQMLLQVIRAQKKLKNKKQKQKTSHWHYAQDPVFTYHIVADEAWNIFTCCQLPW